MWRRCVRLVLKSRACATRKDYGTRTGRRNVKWLIHHLLFSLNTLDNGGIMSSFSRPHFLIIRPRLAYVYLPSMFTSVRKTIGFTIFPWYISWNGSSQDARSDRIP